MRRLPETVLFDLDNTLVPFLEPLRCWADAWARRAAGPDRRGLVADELVAATLDGPEDPLRGVEHVAERFELAVPPEEACEVAERAYREAVEPYPGVCGMLGDLWRADVTLGLVTDAPRDRALVRIDATGLTNVFDVIVTRDETPDGKQGPEPFELALSVLDGTPERSAMIGDWPAFDVAWPKRMGMQAILAGWGIDPDDPRSHGGSPPCPIAGHPSEVPDLLAENARTRPSPTPRRIQTTKQAALTSY